MLRPLKTNDRLSTSLAENAGDVASQSSESIKTLQERSITSLAENAGDVGLQSSESIKTLQERSITSLAVNARDVASHRTLLIIAQVHFLLID
jgi:hypothetical protein